MHNDKQIVQALIEQWPLWGISSKPLLVKEYGPGNNHKVFLLEYENTKIVLKVFKHSFEHSIEVQVCAARANIAPKIIFQDKAQNYCVMRHIEESPRHYSSQRTMAEVHALKELHALAPTCLGIGLEPFDYLDYCKQYLATLPSVFTHAHQRLIKVFAGYLEDTSSLVVSHNDLVVDNCFYENGSSLFIDWEFAQLNKPIFDLASIAHGRNYTQAQLRSFVEQYYGQPQLNENLGRLHSAMCAVAWLSLLWYKQHQHQKVETAQIAMQLRSLREYTGALDTNISSEVLESLAQYC